MKKRIRISENTINKAVKHSLSELFNRNNNQQSANVNSTYTQFTTRLSDMLYQYEMLNSIMGEQGFLNSLGQQGNEVKKYIEMSRQFIEYACYGGGFGSGNNNLGVTPQHKSYFKTTNNAQFDFQNILGDIYYQYSILESLMSTNGFINSLPNGKNIYKYISSAKNYIERACSILGVSGQHKSYMSESRKRIRLTESDLHRIVKTSVKRILNEYGLNNSRDNSNVITMEGITSTLSVMKYIRDNGLPNYGHVFFNFPKSNESLIVSRMDKGQIKSTLMLNPIETWHDVFGMKRLCEDDGLWYAYIDGELYEISC